MSNVKRYYSFLLGIIAASITWSVVLYFYVKLGNDGRTSVLPSDVSSNISLQNSKEKKTYEIGEDVVLPYEDSLKSIYYQKKKYFKNSDKLVKHLQPIVSGMSHDLGKLDLS